MTDSLPPENRNRHAPSLGRAENLFEEKRRGKSSGALSQERFDLLRKGNGGGCAGARDSDGRGGGGRPERIGDRSAGIQRRDEVAGEGVSGGGGVDRFHREDALTEAFAVLCTDGALLAERENNACFRTFFVQAGENGLRIGLPCEAGAFDLIDQEPGN